MKEITIDFWAILILFGAFHGFALSVVLFLKKRHRFTHRIFASLLFAFSLHLLEYASVVTGFIQYIPRLHTTSYPLLLTMGPLLFFYSKSITGQKVKIWGVNLLHFIPALIMAASMMRYFTWDLDSKMRVIESVLERRNDVSYSIKRFLSGLGFFLYNLTYVLISRRVLVKAQVKNSLTESTARSVVWFKRVLLGYAVFILSCVAAYFTFALLEGYPKFVDYLHVTIMMLVIQLIGYVAVNEPLLFGGDDSRQPLKYKKSSLDDGLLNAYKEKLETFMQAEKPYLEDISILDVAEALQISKHHLSQVLNQGFGCTFYEYLNGYRVEEAKQIIDENRGQKLKFIDIAYEAGFSNKVSFYRAFKKQVGLSPTEYYQRANLPSSPQ